MGGVGWGGVGGLFSDNRASLSSTWLALNLTELSLAILTDQLKRWSTTAYYLKINVCVEIFESPNIFLLSLKLFECIQTMQNFVWTYKCNLLMMNFSIFGLFVCKYACMLVSFSVSIYVSFFFCLSTHLFVSLSICVFLCVYMSVFFLSVCLLLNIDDSNMCICQYVSLSI